MKTHLVTWATIVGLVGGLGTVGHAQEKAEKITPIKLQVVLSRTQGEKKISSMPYTLAVSVGPPVAVAGLRMGAKIPVAMMMPMNPGAPSGPGPVQYQDVGTNIDGRVVPLDDGRFRVELTVEDTSVYPDDAGKGNQNPTFRSFRATNSMILKDGQTQQFTAATDKVSGEVTKIDVTLTIVK